MQILNKFLFLYFLPFVLLIVSFGPVIALAEKLEKQFGSQLVFNIVFIVGFLLALGVPILFHKLYLSKVNPVPPVVQWLLIILAGGLLFLFAPIILFVVVGMVMGL
jgi:hypothetical protein